MPSGVACQCSKCVTPRWYEGGNCQGCDSGADVQYTWIAKSTSGGQPAPAPADTLQLQPGVSSRLIDTWVNLILLRSLTPVRVASKATASQLVSPGWYRQRGLHWYLRVDNPPFDLNEKINRAADWTNQAFLIRLIATFEAFADGKKLNSVRLPNNPGVREFHHARRLRNAVAHGDALTDSRDIEEETLLFRPGKTTLARHCNLEIDVVLEPLWARLLLYALSLEQGAAVLPSNPAIVATVDGSTVVVQSFTGKQEQTVPAGDPRLRHTVGDVISL